MSVPNKPEYCIRSSDTTHIGRFDIVYDIIERNGGAHPYSYVKMKKGVGVLGMCGGKVILLRQYRYIWDEWMWEIPGGMAEEGEDPEAAAIRELEEETGFKVKSIRSLGKCYPSVGATTEIQYLYLAECEEGGRRAPDPLETISVKLVSIDEFEEMIKNNEFCHGMGLAAWGILNAENRNSTL